jgi:hypothetical protein
VIGIGVTETQFTTTVSQKIGPSQSYSFRVQARNLIGLSTYSETLTVLAAVVPTKLSAPVLSPTLADSIVVINWSAPLN